ncbi:MAG: DNA alkylation repair protein [Saprospiraceae bacterium]
MQSIRQDSGPVGIGSMSPFYYMPHSLFVAEYGLNHFEHSMQALYEITKRFTSEFAIRPFLIKYPEQTLSILAEWTQDPSEHVRRLVSEGTRPRLPWAMRLPEFQKDPQPALRLLELLRNDPSEYVRRSVANHLNDISKDHPELVLRTCEKWWLPGSENMQSLCSHALRTLVKAGHPEALAILGFRHRIDVTAKLFIQNHVVNWGQDLIFEATVTLNEESSRILVIEYIVHYLKANGSYSLKVFRLTKETLESMETKSYRRKRSMQDLTTRKHYPGIHYLEIQVNGNRYDKKAFELLS